MRIGDDKKQIPKYRDVSEDIACSIASKNSKLIENIFFFFFNTVPSTFFIRKLLIYIIGLYFILQKCNQKQEIMYRKKNREKSWIYGLHIIASL